MYVIASLLDVNADRSIRGIWNTLEKHCDLPGMKNVPTPHITWQIAENYSFEDLEDRLLLFTKLNFPFEIHTNGLGIFTGNSLVLYLNLLTSKELIDFHQLLWDDLKIISTGMNMVYRPGEWVPHITLAHKDLTISNLPCAVSHLLNINLKMNITIDNISILYSIDNNAGIHSTFKFSKQRQVV